MITADMQAVDGVIRSQLYSDVPLVSQIADYIISAGGKRIRPALVLLTANAWGYRGTEHHKLAAVIEFIHTATLLHDDVVDESELDEDAEQPMRFLAMLPRCWWAILCIPGHSK